MARITIRQAGFLHEQAARRYDPHFDAREPPREYDQEMVDRRVDPQACTASEAMCMCNGGPSPPYKMCALVSPRMVQQGLLIEPKDRHHCNGEDKDSESIQPGQWCHLPHSMHIPPARVVDDDYNQGAINALMGLSAYRSSDSRDSSPPPSFGSNVTEVACPSPPQLPRIRFTNLMDRTIPMLVPPHSLVVQW
ncbi:hypothetical protein OBBRIDRAFT_837086 [Obba rivulosa]|uniref:Uncharacterized protein n=1 Tax=Obba rivulosa TaxID=1052685 RepID=A0A8E2AYK7_9APHY|nr:hypothetical protein OBBRIDRAFT_837086 [Obba rivulosa]